MMVLADSAVAQVSALVTVVFAFLTLVAAAVTISEAKKARKEAGDAHSKTMKEQAALLNATTAAHEEEMDERLEASLSEQALQRLVRLGHMGELIAEVARVAGEEADQRGENQHDRDEPLPAAPDSPVIALLKRLEVEIRIYEALGSEPQDALRAYAERHQWLGVSRATIQKHAEKHLGELAELVEGEDETLSKLFEQACARYERRSSQRQSAAI